MVLGGPDFRLPRRRILESSHFWPEATAEVDLLVHLEQKSRAKKKKRTPLNTAVFSTKASTKNPQSHDFRHPLLNNDDWI